ncbi:hypothetical protein Z043_123277, partial [Scleropages formosus]
KRHAVLLTPRLTSGSTAHSRHTLQDDEPQPNGQLHPDSATALVQPAGGATISMTVTPGNRLNRHLGELIHSTSCCWHRWARASCTLVLNGAAVTLLVSQWPIDHTEAGVTRSLFLQPNLGSSDGAHSFLLQFTSTVQTTPLSCTGNKPRSYRNGPLCDSG